MLEVYTFYFREGFKFIGMAKLITFIESDRVQLLQVVDCDVEGEVYVLEGSLLDNRVAL